MNHALSAPALRRYRQVALITIAAVYFLILVGATVRASGAGMGCPDWPTCFGRWIPPLHESQLPANYQEIYAELGYAETRFNAVKTWTEYLNRLTGVAIGLLILLTAICAWPCRHFDRWIPRASLGAFIMVGIQGWLGARVVGSNLQPGMITIHMLMALVIVGVLLFAFFRANRERMNRHPMDGVDRRFALWLYVAIGCTLLQVTLGTQVREMTDFISRAQGEAARSSWIQAMPWFFYVHRSFSALVLLANGWLLYLLLRSIGFQHLLTRLAAAMLAAVVLAILSGAALGHLGMPAFIQPAHLLAASLLFGLQFLIWMGYRQGTVHGRDGHQT